MSIEKIKKVTCIICMSKHPTKTVTDARKSKTVLKKSVNVLHYLASVTTHSKQPSTPLEIKKKGNKILYVMQPYPSRLLNARLQEDWEQKTLRFS